MNLNGKDTNMTSSNTRIAAFLVAAALTLIPAAFAEDAMVRGEVKKIDMAAGKITLKHGPIKSLGMDDASMTMVFRVQDPAWLKQVKAGDKVQFEVGNDSAGLTISKLQKAK
jgi:Cu(I)/Ag(I) efflux system protein CusF